MKVNANKVKKVVLLMALLAPMVYLFGTLFEALKGSNGEGVLASESTQFNVSDVNYLPFDGVSASVSNDYVLAESTFTLSNVFGFSSYVDGVMVDSSVSGLELSNGEDSFKVNWTPVLLRSSRVSYDDLFNVRVGVYTFTGNETWIASGNAYYLSNVVLRDMALPASNADLADVFAGFLPVKTTNLLYAYGDGNSGISVSSGGTIYIGAVDFPNRASFAGQKLLYGLSSPVSRSFDLPSSFVLSIGGSISVVSNLDNRFSGEFVYRNGDYVVSPMSFSDYLFSQFFDDGNFLAASGLKVIDGAPDYGFKPAGDLIRFVDGNMFHLANVEYGALVIGYTYYAFHVVCVFLIFNLLMFFPHLIENIYEKFERGW